MPLAMLEGFDYYPDDTSAPGVGLGSSWIPGNGVTVLTAGRFEGKCMWMDTFGAGEARAVRVISPTTNGRCGFGAAMKPQDLPDHPAGAGDPVLQLTLPTDTFSPVLTVTINDIGQVQVWNGLTDRLIGLCPRLVLNNTWHYIECEFVIHATSGSCKFWIDGELQFDKPGINTLLAGRDQVGRMVIRSRNHRGNYWDDMYYIVDENETLGESRIQLLQPTSDITVEWTPTPTNPNWQNIDDPSTDGDATYNATNTVDARDWFGITDISVNPNAIHAVGLVMAAKKQDSGTRIIANSIRSASAVRDSNHAQTSDYTWSRDIFATDPNGDVAWTKESVNALNVGYRLIL